MRPTAPLAALALCALAACGKDRVPIGTVMLREGLPETFTGIGVSLDRGQVAIARAMDRALEVEAEVRVRSDRALEFEGKALRFEDHVAIEARADGMQVFRSAHDGAADGDDWELRLTIRVPADPAVQIKLDAGSASVALPVAKGLSADIDAGQLDASIDRIEGPTAVRIDAGQIRVAAREAVGSVSLAVDAGQIELTLPEAFTGSIDAQVDVGEVAVAPRFGLTAERKVASQSVKGSVGAEAVDRTVVLRVDAGQIKLR